MTPRLTSLALREHIMIVIDFPRSLIPLSSSGNIMGLQVPEPPMPLAHIPNSFCTCSLEELVQMSTAPSTFAEFSRQYWTIVRIMASIRDPKAHLHLLKDLRILYSVSNAQGKGQINNDDATSPFNGAPRRVETRQATSNSTPSIALVARPFVLRCLYKPLVCRATHLWSCLPEGASLLLDLKSYPFCWQSRYQPPSGGQTLPKIPYNRGPLQSMNSFQVLFEAFKVQFPFLVSYSLPVIPKGRGTRCTARVHALETFSY